MTQVFALGSLAAGVVLFLLTTINAAGALIACTAQFGTMLRRRGNGAVPVLVAADLDDRFVSVHVPTHDEPPALVIATLHALAAMTGTSFEVIVLDNNTRDPNRWRPVAAVATELGPRFRFFHFDGVAGAKAGALNLALSLADPRTTHVAVVDADYQVDPAFLSDALAALATHPVDYVQFPQAYRGVGQAARGVERELGDYFAAFARATGRTGAMLPTGTLSVFTREALVAAGGWSAATITEDAELGVRLHAAGRTGLWLADQRGTGLLPLDFAGLRNQRARWVAGNVQVLLGAVRGSRGGLRAVATLIAQLTAWVSLWLLPAGALALLAVIPTLPGAAATRMVAAATIIGSAALTAVRMRLAMPTGPGARGEWMAAMTTKLALTWTAALAWLPAVTGRALPFQRTLKEADGSVGSGARGVLAASLLFLAVALVYATRGDPAAAVACGLLAAVWPASRAVDANLRAA